MTEESWTWLIRAILIGIGTTTLGACSAGVVALFRMHTSLVRMEAMVITLAAHGRRLTSIERFLMVKHGYTPREESDA